jgi:hypothetical protein
MFYLRRLRHRQGGGNHVLRWVEKLPHAMRSCNTLPATSVSRKSLPL